ncbi:unnamed protein product [Caenorhabditis sp. 36 PRJEB53466]|nr:unnamed protein product [Caenorhabditis sp. 36 PRJEB53466]
MSSVNVPHCTPFQGEEWAAYGQTVEQQIAGEGRRLQPTLQYSLEKLDMVQKYKVQLKVEQVGEYKYKFNEMVKDWVEHCHLAQSDLQAAQIVEHPDGWKTGMEWLGETCDFSALFITNKPNCTKKLHVFVNALRKYIVSVVIISENGTSYTFQFESQTFVVVSNYSQQFKAKKAELKAAKSAENPSRAQKRPSERTAEPKTKQRKVCAVESEQVQVQQEQQAPSEVSSNAPFQMNPFEQNDPEGDNVEWVQIEEDEVVPEDQEEDNVEWVQIEEDQVVPEDQEEDNVVWVQVDKDEVVPEDQEGDNGIWVQVDEDGVVPEDQEGDNVTWVQVDEDGVVPEDQVFYDYLPVEQQEVGDNVPLQQYPSENNDSHGQQVLIQEQIEDEQLMREFFYSPEQQQWNNQVENVENVVPHQVSTQVPLQNYESTGNAAHNQQGARVQGQHVPRYEQVRNAEQYPLQQQQPPHQSITHPQGANVMPSQVSANAPFQNNWHVEHQYQQHHNGFQGQNGNVENQRMPTSPGTNGQWNPEPRQPHY